ncbi:MAG: hypothetical protein F6J97_20725 [Leptolyngbya sp. SIO4C1]|nr:hypothetical protein [Leptolyngbya sp. SIO4C1]
MANPHPTQTDALKRKWFKSKTPFTLAKTPTAIKLPVGPVDVYAIARELPADTLREIIIEGLHQRGLLSDEQLVELGFDGQADT